MKSGLFINLVIDKNLCMTSLPQFISDSRANILIDPIILDQAVSIDELPTPALTIDLDVFDANLLKMQNYLAGHQMDLRCHTKMHKCPIIARKQIEHGALGVCCATVSEAEIMLMGGIKNILITSPVVTEDKLKRVIELAKQSKDIAIVIDHIENAVKLNNMAQAEEVELSVYIDLDPGMGRTGVSPGEDALNLGIHIVNECSNLKFNGLQMYAGNCMHIVGHEKRQAKYQKILEKGRETKKLFEANDIAVPVFTGGGTGTFDMESDIGLMTELQAGSYVFMDVEYRDVGGKNSTYFSDFDASLFVLVTAISQPQSGLITVDAGIKSLATDTAYPEFRDVEGVVYHFGGDEHGIIKLNNPSRSIELGDRLSVLTPHCDPTVNLYDYYFPYRNGMVEEIWPISARGKSQ
ncbi:MAG: 3-hydroxy-D-aspartate aldolase [Candidatus Azotimanducaceae bacterium]|jgi:3-hydroxy-D-aspartate aldolase